MLVRLYGKLPFQRRKLKKIHKQPNIKLNFGCGLTHYSDWINIDGFFAKHVDIVLDLRRSLPFADNTVDYCYSEHFLEHLYPIEGMKHLSEVLRILKPGGVYRVVVPAGIRFAEKYINNDNDFFKLAFPWCDRPIEAVYDIVNFGGEHRNIFDLPQLNHMGKKVGFSLIKESAVNASQSPSLQIDKSDPQRVAESLYVEFVKAVK